MMPGCALGIVPILYSYLYSYLYNYGYAFIVKCANSQILLDVFPVPRNVSRYFLNRKHSESKTSECVMWKPHILT